MAGERLGHGMTSVNQTRPHCVNQMGKTHSKPLAARHGRGTAWARRVMCELAFTEYSYFLAHSRSHRKMFHVVPSKPELYVMTMCQLSTGSLVYQNLSVPFERRVNRGFVLFIINY